MSIIMLAGTQPVASAAVDSSTVDARVKPLLDHIACELAQEYIRLMEATVEMGDDTSTAAGDQCS